MRVRGRRNGKDQKGKEEMMMSQKIAEKQSHVLDLNSWK